MKRQTFGTSSVASSGADVDRTITAMTDEADDVLVADFREKLLDEIDLNELSKLDLPQRRARLERVMTHLVASRGPLLSSRERTSLIRRVVAEALGLGVLEPLLADDAVTEIMVNGPDQIFIERLGRIELAKERFVSNEQLLQTIDRIVSTVNRRVDESSPMVDARLRTGERVNVILPPLALDGPVVTIRKFPRPFSMDQLVSIGTLDERTADLLAACVRAKLNVLVSGGTGSGKTTLLNSLSSFIPERERIVTIEDAAELSLQQTHVIRLESRPANVEGKGSVTIRDLVRNALRMRPDRIIVGEVRGGETMDMLSAMNTGHEGSLTTIHSNSPDEALSRAETLASMSDLDLPFQAVQEQVNNALDLIIQLDRAADGTRRITRVALLSSKGREPYKLHTLSEYVQEPLEAGKVSRGEHVFRPLPLAFVRRLQLAGEAVPDGATSPALD
ncbi:CpaF family protein [Aeromicrobium sp. 50.2.37]|uniref:CpaF family protein n=2 Tax=unclassified Aeromicrobium TaxID=2633570 RepID=UPI00214FF0E1|nr:CpaF family protein [Aeromicrobium sp. 50.2.37]MCR4513546.1 CpaF family protein [Aeromicrobium sp. 50.2.37]